MPNRHASCKDGNVAANVGLAPNPLFTAVPCHNRKAGPHNTHKKQTQEQHFNDDVLQSHAAIVLQRMSSQSASGGYRRLLETRQGKRLCN